MTSDATVIDYEPESITVKTAAIVESKISCVGRTGTIVEYHPDDDIISLYFDHIKDYHFFRIWQVDFV